MSEMSHIEIRIGSFQLAARLERQQAASSCAWFQSRLPLKTRIIHARWSGEACWIPFGRMNLDLVYENHTSYPAPGQLLLYPGALSETEILLPYGATAFASKVGQLAGNHFATITKGAGWLREIGELVLWKGAQEIEFTEAWASQDAEKRGLSV